MMQAYFRWHYIILFVSCWIFSTSMLAQAKFKLQTIRYTPEITAKKTVYSVSKQTLKNNTLTLWVENDVANIPFREESIQAFYDSVYAQLPATYREYQLEIICNNRTLDELVPNAYRKTIAIDDARKFTPPHITPVVQNVSKPYTPTQGLLHRHIALWNSHGWYYSATTDKWDWQRGRLFGTVEDMLTTAIVLPYVLPMLENAGANVFIPRERDTQTNEVILDNDDDATSASITQTSSWEKKETGFKNKKLLQGRDNPFTMGSFLQTPTYEEATDSIEWKIKVPENGMYYVSIAYKSVSNSTESARYSLHHAGGTTRFSVNQQLGGGTWIYLGNYYFIANKSYSLVLTNSGKEGYVVTADVVRVGGGMGNIDRQTTESIVEKKLFPPFIDEDAISQPPLISTPRARFTEAARYYLQWAGMPDSILINQRKDVISDYQDDIFGRANWVNYLMGGSVMYPSYKGLGIPIDACIALHTDAGKMSGDSIVGTLGIAMTTDDKGMYPANFSRMAARDFTDMVQSELVHDIRATFPVNWTRREIWDKSYIEARIPKTPTTIIELLSHQNFNDMRYAHCPEFRFVTARAIYKGIVKFLASQYNQPYTIQPLPITHFVAEVLQDDSVHLSWRKTTDPLEPTANPDGYIVYTRKNDGGFDNGIVSKTESITLPIEKGTIYSYKIAALNNGGESFASEILSVYKAEIEKGKAWVVNAFDRVAAPSSFETDSTAGFTHATDRGVPYLYDLSFTGNQIEYNKSVPFYDNDYTGFGASQANYDGQVIAGNTFDNCYIHGRALAANNYSFSSASRDGITVLSPSFTGYDVLAIILGNQKTSKTFTRTFTVYPTDLQTLITNYTKQNGKIIVSGAYIASDITRKKDKSEMQFAQNILKYKLRMPQASVNATMVDVFSAKKRQREYNCFTQPNPYQYAVQQVDAIQPTDKNSSVLLRYTENNTAAAIGYKGKYKTIVCGFPFETLTSTEQQNELMRLFVNY